MHDLLAQAHGLGYFGEAATAYALTFLTTLLELTR